MGNVGNLGWAGPAMIIALSVASHARADDNQPPTVPTAQTTEIDAGSTVLYDSNIARSDRLIAAERGLKLADVITTPEGEAVVARQLGLAMLFVDVKGGYDFHAVNTFRDRGFVDAYGGGGARVGSCQTSLIGGYTQTQADLADIQFGFINNTQTQESVSFSGVCGHAVGLAPSISVSQTWLDNSALIYKPINNEDLTVQANLGYQRPSFGLVSLQGVFSTATYPDRVVMGPTGSVIYGYTLYSGGLHYEKPVGARISVLASVSYTTLTPDVTSGPSFSGLTYSLDVTYAVTSRFQAHLNVGRATVPSNRTDANYSVNDDYIGDLSYQMGSRLKLKLTVDSKSANYQGVRQAGPLVDLTRETTYDVIGAVDYEMTHRVTIGLAVGDSERRADLMSLSYSSTTVSLTAKAKFRSSGAAQAPPARAIVREPPGRRSRRRPFRRRRCVRGGEDHRLPSPDRTQ